MIFKLLCVSLLVSLASAGVTCASTHLSTQGWSRMDASEVTIANVRITSDSSKVVYLADNGNDGLNNLFVVDITGGVATQLNVPLGVATSTVSDFILSGDDQFVVYRGNLLDAAQQELWSVPIAGPNTASIKLNNNRMGGTVPASTDYRFPPGDNGRVVFRGSFKQDMPQHAAEEMYSIAVTGPAGSAIRLSSAVPAATRPVAAGWFITATSQRVIYTGSLLMATENEIFSSGYTAIDTQVVLNINKAGAGSPVIDLIRECGTRILFRGSFGTGANTELYSADAVGVANNAVRISKDGTMTGANSPLGYLCAAQNRVIYWGALDDATRQDVYSTNVQMEMIVTLSNVMNANGVIAPGVQPELSPDLSRVVYVANHDMMDPTIDVLWSAGVAGTANSAVRISTKVATDVGDGTVLDFRISPDSASVAFRARQAIASPYLYIVGIGGGANTLLNANIVGGAVRSVALRTAYEWTPNSATVVFIGDFNQNDAGVLELYVAGTAVTQRRLSGPGNDTPRRQVSASDFLILDDTRVIFIGDLSISGVNELYTSAIGTADAALKINPSIGFGESVPTARGSPVLTDKSRIIFNMARLNGLIEIWSGFPDASQAAQRVNQLPAPGGSTAGFQVAPNQNLVVYTGRILTDKITDLFVACTRSGPPPTAAPPTAPPTNPGATLAPSSAAPTRTGQTLVPTAAPAPTAGTASTSATTTSGAASLVAGALGLLVLALL